MGKIVKSNFVSLDGVVQDPAGNEGFKRGGWVGPLKDREELNRLALDEALGAEALCWVGAAMSSSPRSGPPGAESWRTG